MKKKPAILVCDDEEGIRESLKLILGETHDLVFACSGQECLETLKNSNKQIGLVLMDIKMPKQNGIEVTRQIKRLYPHIKVFIVTGYESSEIAQEATQAGADDYIVKPFDATLLKSKTSTL